MVTYLRVLVLEILRYSWNFVRYSWFYMGLWLFWEGGGVPGFWVFRNACSVNACSGVPGSTKRCNARFTSDLRSSQGSELQQFRIIAHPTSDELKTRSDIFCCTRSRTSREAV